MRLFVVSAVATILVSVQSLHAQVEAWRCGDPRVRLSLWCNEVVQGTQLRFARDGALWALELRGRLLRLEETDTGVKAETVFDLGKQAWSAAWETGATSLVLDPDFDGRSGTLYLAHNWDDQGPDGRRLGAVTQVTLHDGVPLHRRTVFGPIESADAHQVDRLELDGNGDLLVSIGDLRRPHLAQEPDGPYGKVLRFAAAGLAKSGADGPAPYTVEAMGLRSPFALRRRSSDGLVVIGNNGPLSDDSLLLLRKGANYGWGLKDSPAPPAETVLHLWPRTVSPVSVCFYELPRRTDEGQRFPPEFDGNMFVCLFGKTRGPGAEWRKGRGELERGRQVLRFELEGTTNAVRVKRASVFLTYTGKDYECPLDIAVGPKGDLFLLTFAIDPQWPGTSRIYRVRYVGDGGAVKGVVRAADGS